MREITELLKAWNDGDTQALDKLMPLVEKELRNIAKGYMRKENREHILQTTALVHEALIKIIRENTSYVNRKHFYALVAKRMRQVLIDYARKRPKAEYIDIDEVDISDETSKELRMLDDALKKLATIDERKVTIIECRYFIGLNLTEIAELLNTSPATVQRDWSFARAWLKREMS